MFSVNEGTSRLKVETFAFNGNECVILIHLCSEALTSSDEEAAKAILRRFVAHQKETPQRYYMIIDTHKVLTFPFDTMVTIHKYLTRKERYLRDHLCCTSYVIQGRFAEMALNTLNGMFDSWKPSKVFKCYPQTPSIQDHEHGIPRETFQGVMTFIRTSAPPKAP